MEYRSSREYGAGNGDLRPYSDKPTGELLKAFVGEGQKLMREELRLAKTEFTHEVKKAGVAAGLIAGGGVVAHAAFGVLCLALVFALATVMPAWAAALIVGVLLAGVAAALGFVGKKRLEAVNPKPEQTIETLKEDKKWVKDMMHGKTSMKHGTA